MGWWSQNHLPVIAMRSMAAFMKIKLNETERKYLNNNN